MIESLQVGQVVIDIQSLEQIEITKQLEPGLWEAKSITTGRTLKVTLAQVMPPPKPRKSQLLASAKEEPPTWSWYKDDQNRRWLSASNSTFQVRAPGESGPEDKALADLVTVLNKYVELPQAGIAQHALRELDGCIHMPLEAGHKHADEILCSVLLALGQSELVRRFHQLKKFYSMKWAGLPFGETKG